MALTSVEKFVRKLEREEDEVWERYTSLLSRFDTTDISDWTAELERLHSSRSSRRLMLKRSITPDDIIKVNLEDLATRSRIVEILLTLGKRYRLLEKALSAVYGHLTTTYPAEIDALVTGRTKGERQEFVEAVMKEGWDTQSKLDLLKANALMIVEDIDKGSWTYRNLVEMVKIVSQRESIVSQVGV